MKDLLVERSHELCQEIEKQQSLLKPTTHYLVDMMAELFAVRRGLLMLMRGKTPQLGYSTVSFDMREKTMEVISYYTEPKFTLKEKKPFRGGINMDITAR